MLRYFFAFFLFMHGIIHFMGFSKAFGYGKITQLSVEISRTAGVFWIITALLFIASTIFFLMRAQWWWMVAIMAIIVSQVLIFTDWQDAKYGTIANAVILIVVVMSFGQWNFSRSYKADVKQELKRTSTIQPELLTEEDIMLLPVLVQNYLRYVGVLDQPKVHNMKVVFEGEMRQKGKDWFHFSSEQYNFFDVFSRLFFMEANMYGMKVPGYHRYIDGNGTMNISLFGLIPVNKTKGPEMNQAETVTVFNDMCLMAPATLIDKRIQWKVIDNSSVKASFTVNNISINVTLHFNSKGQLVNFVSDDRYLLPGGMRYRFSTPVRAYRNINGYNLNSEGEAVWQYPEGEFIYARIRIKDIQYNKGFPDLTQTSGQDEQHLTQTPLQNGEEPVWES